jgi:hypothetical protein
MSQQPRRPRYPLGQRVHNWLAEPEGEQFKLGKWRFWFIAVAFLSVVNATITWLIFRDDSDNYSGPIMLSAGTLVAWLCVGALHYSDSANKQLARGVSVIDSAALLFVVFHFAGLLYIYGHYRTLRSEEARYEAQAEKFNAKAEQVSSDNVKIAEAGVRISDNERQAERLRNDTAYQTRKAYEAGARPPGQRTAGAAAKAGIGAGLSTQPIELERPDKPKQSSAGFLNTWDWLIRAANFGELFLACLTLILIRNVSARSNTPTAPIAAPPPQYYPDYTDAVSPSPYARRTRAGFVTAENSPRDTGPKSPGNWI